MTRKTFTFRAFGFVIGVSIERPAPIPSTPFQPRITKKKANSGLRFCHTIGKVGYPEPLAKLRAKQMRKNTTNGYLRAYHCEFCPDWHLTHLKNKLTFH